MDTVPPNVNGAVVVLRQLGRIATSSPGSKTPLPSARAGGSTTSPAGTAATVSFRQAAAQPSPPTTLPSSHCSSDCTRPLPQTEGGMVPACPALLTGVGTTARKSLALSAVSSQSS